MKVLFVAMLLLLVGVFPAVALERGGYAPQEVEGYMVYERMTNTGEVVKVKQPVIYKVYDYNSNESLFVSPQSYVEITDIVINPCVLG